MRVEAHGPGLEPLSARSGSATFDTEAAMRAHEVRRAEDGRRSLIWSEHTAQGERTYHIEPNTSLGRRMGVDFMTVLPIEWLL
jgi:cardiolipin synthase C